MALGCTIAEAQVSELQLLRVYWGYIANNGKKNGNYYNGV